MGHTVMGGHGVRDMVMRLRWHRGRRGGGSSGGVIVRERRRVCRVLWGGVLCHVLGVSDVERGVGWGRGLRGGVERWVRL